MTFNAIGSLTWANVKAQKTGTKGTAFAKTS